MEQFHLLTYTSTPYKNICLCMYNIFIALYGILEYMYIRLFDNLIYFDVWVRSRAGLRLVSDSQISKSQNQLNMGTFFRV